MCADDLPERHHFQLLRRQRRRLRWALIVASDCAADQVCGGDGICKGNAGCKPSGCANGTNFSYCGEIGDGCGGRVNCACTADQVCGKDNLCKGDASCVPLTCANGTSFSYCGLVGDNCGGELTCSSTCAAGQVCDAKTGLCKGDSSCVAQTSCANGTEFSYCGTIGDGCGGSLVCPSDSCSATQVCDTTNHVCKGNSACVPQASCANGTQFSYCGTIGDGCGGKLVCPASSCSAGQVCDTTSHICQGGASCVPQTSCGNGTDFNYCGTIGNGCGGSLVCPADSCTTGQVCNTQTDVCHGDSTCVPKTSCSNGTPFNYCGTIGDGCGGSIACATNQCGTGKVCDTSTNQCKGDASCVPLTCVLPDGGQYCGGVVGDGCGGSITCNGACPSGTTCTGHACVCNDGLVCHVAKCDAGSTTITGKVYDPAGLNPLYNVIVYIPNTTLGSITHGATCDRCATPSGEPITAQVSGTDGSFTLTNAPSGTNIPIVFQIGKWRRQVEIPTVSACTTNDLTGWKDSNGIPYGALAAKPERRRQRHRLAAQDRSGRRRGGSSAVPADADGRQHLGIH